MARASDLACGEDRMSDASMRLAMCNRVEVERSRGDVGADLRPPTIMAAADDAPAPVRYAC